MAWAKNYLRKRPKQAKVKVIDDIPPAPNAKRIRPRVGWLPIGRTRQQWRHDHPRLTGHG